MTVWFLVSSLGPCSTPALHLIFPAGSVQILSLCQGEQRSDASIAAFPRSVRCCVWFAAGQECEVVVWHFRRRGRMVVDIPLVARSLWDVRSSSGIPGLSRDRRAPLWSWVLCGAGELSDTHWYKMADNFCLLHFIKVSLETLHQFRVFHTSLETGRLNPFHWPTQKTDVLGSDRKGLILSLKFF